MRPTRQEWAMGLARLTAERATCLRRRVGCVLLNVHGHVLATGYNGVARGMPHCNEITGTLLDRRLVGRPLKAEHGNACPGAQAPSGTNLEGCQAIHAEQNALLQCRDVHEIDVAYVTTSPCMTCAKLLLNTGCGLIVYEEPYGDAEAVERLWCRSGRGWFRAGGTA